ncbi:MAG: single-stranded DNA-binding protein [bacterium]|nr:single-stranded DNA-binding protein [bacterium]
MLNQVILVGRIVRAPELRESESGKKLSFITLAVPRSFKNMSGQYDTDFIDCVLWDQVAASTVQYCHKGDIVGVKGRLQSRVVEKETGNVSLLTVVAEKVTFLTNKKSDEKVNR